MSLSKIQKAVLKKESKLVFLLSLFLFTSSVSCTQKSFLCWNEKRTKAMAFAFDDILNHVKVRDIHGYSTLTSSKEPLQSHMPGGTHRLQMNSSLITLEVIQDTAYSKNQLPSGKFIKSNTAISEEEYLKQTNYHAVYPVIWRYVFDKKLLTLSFSSSPLPKPRYATKAKFVYDKTADDYFLEKTKDLTAKELSEIFPPEEKFYTDIYPNCEEESFSFKRIIRSIIRQLSFP